MNNFFDVIVQFLNLIYSYIENLINSTITLTSVLSHLPSFTLSLNGVIPPIISASVLIVSSISIVKLIAGWGNQ